MGSCFRRLCGHRVCYGELSKTDPPLSECIFSRVVFQLGKPSLQTHRLRGYLLSPSFEFDLASRVASWKEYGICRSYGTVKAGVAHLSTFHANNLSVGGVPTLS